MTAFLVRRIGLGFVTLFSVLTIVFVIVRILPGDPALLILGDQASQEASRRCTLASASINPSRFNMSSFSRMSRAATGASRWSAAVRFSAKS